MFADVWLRMDLVESSVRVLEYSFLAVSDQFQVYNGQSDFLYNLVSISDFSTFGMPVDNTSPTGRNIAVPSWYFYILKSYFLTLS
jgi:hypothetical protein